MMNRVYRRWLLGMTLLAGAMPVCAQHGGGPGGPGGGGMGGGSMPRGAGPFGGSAGPFHGSGRSGMPGGINPNTGGGARHDLPPGPAGSSSTNNSTMRGGLQLGPPGRFWDDKGFAQDLGLRKDQQKRMDAVFNANRSALVENYRTLQVEEKRLERITKERPLDEARVFAGIDAVVQARGVLEKANAHMLLQLRKEMDDEQATRMDRYREGGASENP